MSKSQILHIQYENLLENPQEILTKKFDFTGCVSDAVSIQNSVQGINKNKRYAFSQTPKLVALYKTIQKDPPLQRSGYGDVMTTFYSIQLSSFSLRYKNKKHLSNRCFIIGRIFQRLVCYRCHQLCIIYRISSKYACPCVHCFNTIHVDCKGVIR